MEVLHEDGWGSALAYEYRIPLADMEKRRIEQCASEIS
jgi:hypothetical protein